MTVVLDASVALKLFVAEEGSAAAEEFVAKQDRIIAPDLIVAELVNALWRVTRTSRMTAAQQIAALGRLSRIVDEFTSLSELSTLALSIAQALNHPAYDCFYLSLCRQRGALMITADRRLIARVAGTEWAGMVIPLY